MRPAAYRDKLNKNKSVVDQIFDAKLAKKDDKKEEKKEEKKEDKCNIVTKSETPVKINIMPPIHQKISLYKSDRKKMVASNIKKQ